MPRAVVITFALLAGLYAAPASAAPDRLLQEHVQILDRTVDRPVDRISPTQFVRRVISPREAKAIALSQVRGEVVDIRKVRDTYRVRIIRSDGQVVDIVVDANTGRIR